MSSGGTSDLCESQANPGHQGTEVWVVRQRQEGALGGGDQGGQGEVGPLLVTLPNLERGVIIRAFPEVWWTFKTFISKLHDLFPSQSIFNLKAPRWAP